MRNAVLIKLVVLFSFSALAGGRLVLNGGGIAEMRAVSLLTGLPTLLEQCLDFDVLCSEQERESFSKVLAGISSRNLSLEYHSECFDQGPMFVEKEAKVVVDSCQLYREDGQPKSLPDLMYLISRPIVASFNSGMEDSLVTLRTLKLTSLADLDDEKYRFEAFPRSIVLNLAISAGNPVFAHIEVDLEAIEITSDLAGALGCAVVDLGIFRATQMAVKNSLLSADLQWQCLGQSRKSAKLLIQLNESMNQLDSLKVIGIR